MKWRGAPGPIRWLQFGVGLLVQMFLDTGATGFHQSVILRGQSEFGLPYGQDRLARIFLASLAVHQKSRAVRIRSAAEMLDTFGLAKGGKEYRRLVAAFERIFGATIFFGTYQMHDAAHVVHRSRFNFIREAEIWCHRIPEEAASSTGF